MLKVAIVLAGSIIGFLFGVLPGMHVNLLANFVEKMPNTCSLYFAASAAAAQSIGELVSAFFLGIPSEALALSVFLEFNDIILFCTAAALLTVIYSFLLIPIVPLVYSMLRQFTLPVLVVSTVALLASIEKREAVIVFILAGVEGFLALKLLPCKNPLLPLLSGLFGLPSLVLKEEKFKVSWRYRDILIGLLAATIIIFVPAVSPSHAIVVLHQVLGLSSFHAAAAATNIADTYLSILSLYTIQKPRIGILSAATHGPISIRDFIYLQLSALISSMVAILFMIPVGRILRGVKRNRLLLFSTLFVVFLTAILSGPIGLLVLATSFLIGYYAVTNKVPLTCCMGSLIVPTIWWFL